MDALKSRILCESIWCSLARTSEIADWVDERDIETFTNRVRAAGLPFLTVTLPSLGKALESSFQDEFVCPPDFKRRKGSIYPVFLGRAIEAACKGDSVAVKAIRQLTLAFYKLEVPPDPIVVQASLDSFIAVDAELGSLNFDGNPIINKARALIGRVLCNIDPTEIVPRHSNGATACRTEPPDKYYKRSYSQRLDDIYPYADHFFMSSTHVADEIGEIGLLHKTGETGMLAPTEELVHRARICVVPKDSRGPRIISCEPSELMYIQQGLKQLLYEGLETHPLTKGYINFTDQTVNRRLAQRSSKDGSFATLDLKDASDRVSLSLVKLLFPENWYECFMACRSDSTVLPYGQEVVLNKFAPMGSACCFPVEALVFWAVSTAATMFTVLERPPDVEGLRVLKSGATSGYDVFASVYVYGDDIIVPTPVVDDVIDALSSVGFVINVRKSFREGPFRESCGGDYHLGVDCSILRLKKPFDGSPESQIAHYQFAQQFYERYGRSWSLYETLVTLYGPIPFSNTRNQSCLQWGIEPCVNLKIGFRRRRYKRFQRDEYRILTFSTPSSAKREPGWTELQKWSLERGVVRGEESEFFPKNKGLDPGFYSDHSGLRATWQWAYLG